MKYIDTKDGPVCPNCYHPALECCCEDPRPASCSLIEQAETLREGFRSLQIWLWTYGGAGHQVPLMTAKVHHRLADKLVVALGGESTENKLFERTL